MSVHWTTDELPGARWDPEPDDGDDGPWCKWPTDLSGQHATTDALDAMTTVPVKGDLL